MKKFWIVIVLATIAISLGCGGDGGAGAGAAAKKMLDAMKEGDMDTVLKYVDLKGLYDKQSEEQRKAMGITDFEAYEKMTKGMLTAMFEASKEETAELEFKILGSQVKDDVTIVKFKTRKNAEAEWEEDEIPFKKVGGTWKAESLK